MNIKNIGLIGFGVIGSPIAHILNFYYKDNFHLIAGGDIRKKIESTKFIINNDDFKPSVISDKNELPDTLDLLIVCVKNYHLYNALEDIKKVISKDTIILPLQNGIFSFNYFAENLPENIILKGYMQGPNTEISENGIISYKNPGVIHIGSDKHTNVAIMVYNILNNCGFPVQFENNIAHMVWSKWMLNVVGNSVTALTNADYSVFKESPDLQYICKTAMEEFIILAKAENMDLSEKDISDVLEYYINYKGTKKTSMLVDMTNYRKTENDFLAGYAMRLANKHNLKLPMIETLYMLIKIKEHLYMRGSEKHECDC